MDREWPHWRMANQDAGGKRFIANITEAYAAGASSRDEEVERLRALVADFVDSDPCRYDHHGYCQAHGWFETDPPCPHKRAKELLGAKAGDG